MRESVLTNALFQMNVWRQAFFPLLCVALSCVDLCCTAPPVLHGASYDNSLHLAKFTRTRVQQLLRRYVSELQLARLSSPKTGKTTSFPFCPFTLVVLIRLERAAVGRQGF